MDHQIETKVLGGRVIEHKEMSVNGVPVGVIETYIAAWGPDTGGRYGVPDEFVPGAFQDSIADHERRRNRQVRLKDLHGRVIGGFPIDTVHEDSFGLRATGHVNLETQAGRELWSLIRQGVLVDMSIGFSAIEDKLEPGTRRIFKAILWEGSIVDEPAHQSAQILEWKAVVPFQDLPLADRDRAWSKSAADRRVRAATGSEDAPSAGYRKAFLWYDQENKEDFEAYKLPIADVIDGKLMAIPKAIFAAAGALRGARGGVKVPSEDGPKLVRHVERYYAKMGEESPWDREERGFVGHVEAQSLSADDVELALRRGVMFSKAAARVVSSRIDRAPGKIETCYDDPRLSSILDHLQEMKRALREGRAPRT